MYDPETVTCTTERVLDTGGPRSITCLYYKLRYFLLGCQVMHEKSCMHVHLFELAARGSERVGKPISAIVTECGMSQRSAQEYAFFKIMLLHSESHEGNTLSLRVNKEINRITA